MQLETRQFNDNISYLDNGLLHAAGLGSTYVVRGDEVAIVETGTSPSARHVLDGLRRLGVDPASVRHIVLTHIHIDHAGGTGTLIKQMPEARVYIHSRTAQFLVDPTDLLASAERALGPLFALHGPVESVPAERIVPADDLRLDLGRGVVLRAVYTPGHSPDHLAYYEENSRSLFTGDSMGIVVPAAEFIGPVTPPPATNVTAQRETFARLLDLDIETLLFSHYGPGTESPRSMIERLQERYEHFVDLVQTQWQAGRVDHMGIIREMLGTEQYGTQSKGLVAGWVDMSINGLVLYFDRQARKAQSGR